MKHRPTIGAVGLTLSVLGPNGEAEFDGASFQVRAEVGSIASGSHVCVTGFDPWSLTVREATADDLAAQAQGKTPVETRVEGEDVLWFAGRLLFGSLVFGVGIWSFAAGGLIGFGVLLAIAGHLWLLLLMVRECQAGAIILYRYIPFFIWYFAWQRWDVAKWPFLINVLGLGLTLVGIVGASSIR